MAKGGNVKRCSKAGRFKACVKCKHNSTHADTGCDTGWHLCQHRRSEIVRCGDVKAKGGRTP